MNVLMQREGDRVGGGWRGFWMKQQDWACNRASENVKIKAKRDNEEHMLY